MIRIQRNSTNTEALTLNERVTLDTPVFLFVFTSDAENVDYPVILADTSTTKGRFNKFDIIESSVANPTGGVIALTTGYYNYAVYEQSSTTNLDPELTTTLLETGKCRVVDNTIETYTEYEDEGADVVYYDPESNIVVNKKCTFDGVDDFMGVSGSDSFTSGTVDFSITLSIDLLSINAAQVLYSSYHSGGGGANDRNIQIRLLSDNTFSVLIRDGGSARQWKTTTTYGLGEHIFVVTVSSSGNSVKLYDNGVEQTFTTTDTVPNPIQSQTAIIPAIMSSVLTGGGPLAPTNAALFYFALHSDVLTAGEVAGLNKNTMVITDNLEYYIPANDFYVNSPTGGNIYGVNDAFSGQTFLTTNVALGALVDA